MNRSGWHFNDFISWRFDRLEESIANFKRCMKDYHLDSFQPKSSKFWGQNFYRRSRNVIPEPEPKGK